MLINSIIENPIIGLAIVIAILLALTFHEFAHGWVANILGDTTAEDQGRLTLNPLPHIDPWGFLMLLFVGFGWGKPVPINPYNFKNMKQGSGLVAIAGPISNLIFAIFTFCVFKLFVMIGVDPRSLVYVFLIYLLNINVILMLFNLIPLPPLDGSKILFSMLPDRHYHVQETLERNGPMILLFLLIMDSFSPVSIFGTLFSGVFRFVNSLL